MFWWFANRDPDLGKGESITFSPHTDHQSFTAELNLLGEIPAMTGHVH